MTIQQSPSTIRTLTHRLPICFLNMTTVLVTGGAGFIGTNLCRELLDDGKRVIAVDNFITSSKKNLSYLVDYKNIVFFPQDITHNFSNELIKACKNVSMIFHLACPTGVANLQKLAEEMLLTCSIGTYDIMQLAKKNNANVVFTSSSEVYGDPKVFPQDESYTGNVNPVGYRSPYEEGKRFSESIVRMFVTKYGVDAKIVRVFNTYGPYMSLNDSRVIPHFFKQLNANMPLTVTGDGKQTRTFCYVDDLVRGLLFVSKKGRKGEAYNLGNDTEIPINDLAKLLLKIKKSKLKVLQIDRPPHDHQRRLPSLEKIKALGWKPEIGIEEGLQESLRWFGL